MTGYCVTWAIDVEADTPEEAAAQALMIQRDMDSTALHFTVLEHHGCEVHQIDLNED